MCRNYEQRDDDKESSFHGTIKTLPEESLTLVPEALPLTSSIAFAFGSNGLRTKPGLFGTDLAVGIPVVCGAALVVVGCEVEGADETSCREIVPVWA